MQHKLARCQGAGLNIKAKVLRKFTVTEWTCLSILSLGPLRDCLVRVHQLQNCLQCAEAIWLLCSYV